MKLTRKFLYVLLCEEDNYYIGQTDDIVRRFRQHKEQGKEGSVWTSNHKPVKIIQFWKIEQYSQEDAINFENKLTLEYINKYGWRKVRGGIYIFHDENHHKKLLEKYNDLIEEKFVPKATQKKILSFLKIKTKILQIKPKKGVAYIYVLELQDNRIYVSRSINPIKDIRKHLYTSKSKWTTKYPPVDLLELIEDTDLGINNPCPHKNQVVLQYMSEYGWKNVRGADYCINDNETIKRLLENKHPEILKTMSNTETVKQTRWQ